VVCERHTRGVGKDALVSFAASHYSVRRPNTPALGCAAAGRAPLAELNALGS
jgi:hypothetical protein